jgi:Putative Flp pilus-assembly TadE/G-like
MLDRNRRRTAGGQIIVLFVLALIGIIGVVGLAIDGGGAYAQRRDQQTAADLAALAGANDYLVNNSSSQAIVRARSVAGTNNYTNGVGSTVGVSIDTSNGVEVQVNIASSHPNSFLGALGMANWSVSTTATALAGFPDSAAGAGPFIFPISAFNDDGTPKYQTPTDFNETNGDIPTSQTDIAWTNYGSGNLNTTEVDQIIKGDVTIDETLAYGQYIGQINSGNHNTLYTDVNTYLAGQDLPVAVVDAGGNFMGWATFHVISASAGSDKHINGYFLSAFTGDRLTISLCSQNACPRYLGTYILKLVN